MRQMMEKDYEQASQLIGKVTRSARTYFEQACTEGKLVRGLIAEEAEAQGVAALVQTENFWVAYISFVDDLLDEEKIQQIEELVAEGIESKGEKSLYLNIYGGNPTLIARFHEQGFKEDMKGYQFRYQRSQGVPTAEAIPEILYPLEVRNYDEEAGDLYIEVTDEAFKPFDLKLGYEPYGSKRHRDEVLGTLKRRGEQNEFAGFWLDDEVIGFFNAHNEYLHTIAVHPKYQSKGWGSNMLQYCIYHMMEKLNYDEIFLNCLEINEKGLHYYKKNGFQVVGYFSENTYRSLPEGE